MIQYQIPRTNVIRIVWQTVKRDLDVKGLQMVPRYTKELFSESRKTKTKVILKSDQNKSKYEKGLEGNKGLHLDEPIFCQNCAANVSNFISFFLNHSPIS